MSLRIFLRMGAAQLHTLNLLHRAGLGVNAAKRTGHLATGGRAVSYSSPIGKSPASKINDQSRSTLIEQKPSSQSFSKARAMGKVRPMQPVGDSKEVAKRDLKPEGVKDRSQYLNTASNTAEVSAKTLPPPKPKDFSVAQPFTDPLHFQAAVATAEATKSETTVLKVMRLRSPVTLNITSRIPSRDTCYHQGGLFAMPSIGRSVVKREEPTTVPVRPYHFFSGKKAETHQSKVKDAATHLPMVEQLKTELEETGGTVIYGAPMSGKTEQMQIALGQGHEIFDLRERFIGQYAKKNNMSEKEVKKKYNSDEMKELELAYLTENRERIVEELRKSPERVIAFDEFDFSNASDHVTNAERKTMDLIFGMAKELKESGKETILIMHDVGLNTPGVFEELLQAELVRMIVQTHYLDEESQRLILNAMGFNEEQIAEIIELSQGDPAIYLEFMKEAANYRMTEDSSDKVKVPDYRDILIEGTQKVIKRWNTAKEYSDKATINLLKQLASGELKITDPQIQENKGKLFATNMFGDVEGKLVFSKIAADVVKGDSKGERVEEFFGEKKIELKSEEDIETYLNDAPEVLKISARNAIQMGGAYLVDGEMKMVVPKCSTIIGEICKNEKREVSNKMNIDRIPLAKNSVIHLTWCNSAANNEELINDANAVKEPFLRMLTKSSRDANSLLLTGENHCFLIKSEKSIESKKKKLSAGGADPEKALQRISDPIRATITADTPEQLKIAIETFRDEAEKNGIEMVFSDKWKENRPNGYVGVHANMMINFTDEKGNARQVRGEVQFHLKDIFDGTDRCAKEVAHRLYEQERKEKQDPQEALYRNEAMQVVFTTGCIEANKKGEKNE